MYNFAQDSQTILTGIFWLFLSKKNNSINKKHYEKIYIQQTIHGTHVLVIKLLCKLCSR